MQFKLNYEGEDTLLSLWCCFNFNCMALGKKTGGRKRGTPNKSTSLGKEVIVSLLNDYAESGLMSKDFMAIEPKDRLVIAERLMQYTIPKMQSTAVDISTADRDKTIEDRLAELAGDDD